MLDKVLHTISLFPIRIFAGISLPIQDFFGFNLSISFLMLFDVLFLNLNLSYIFIFSFIFKILGWYSYILIISGIFSDIMSSSQITVNCSISKLSTASTQKLFNFSATSNFPVYTMSSSIMTILLCNELFLSEKRGLTRCQNVLLSSNIFRSRLL